MTVVPVRLCLVLIHTHTHHSTAITPKRYEIGCQLLLITNRKSHTAFRLVLTSMTLNDLERRNSPYFAFFSPNSIALLADYDKVIDDRPIMSVNIVSQFQSSTFGQN